MQGPAIAALLGWSLLHVQSSIYLTSRRLWRHNKRANALRRSVVTWRVHMTSWTHDVMRNWAKIAYQCTYIKIRMYGQESSWWWWWWRWWTPRMQCVKSPHIPSSLTPIWPPPYSSPCAPIRFLGKYYASHPIYSLQPCYPTRVCLVTWCVYLVRRHLLLDHVMEHTVNDVIVCSIAWRATAPFDPHLCMPSSGPD